MISRFFMMLAYLFTKKENKVMLVRLYAAEIIEGKITEEQVPKGLKARVHQYLVDMGYFEKKTA